jgi:hypothetical protein
MKENHNPNEAPNLYLMLREMAKEDKTAKEVKYHPTLNILQRPIDNETFWGIHDVLWHLGFVEEEVLKITIRHKDYYLPRPVFELMEKAAAELNAFKEEWQEVRK